MHVDLNAPGDNEAGHGCHTVATYPLVSSLTSCGRRRHLVVVVLDLFQRVAATFVLPVVRAQQHTPGHI